VRWNGEFELLDEEREYYRAEIAPVLPQHVTRVSLLMLFLIACYFPLSLHHINVPFWTLLGANTVSTLGLLTLASMASHGVAWASGVLEPAFCCVLGLIMGVSIVLFGPVVDMVHEEMEDGQLMTLLLGDVSTVIAVSDCVLVVSVILTPMVPRSFVLMVGPVALGSFVTKTYEIFWCAAPDRNTAELAIGLVELGTTMAS
jgi:hypothetical protein